MYHQNRPQPQLYFSMNVRTYQLFSARLPTPYPHPLLTHSLIYYFDFLIFCFFLSQPREFFTISILFFFFLQNCIQMFSLLFEMVHLTFLMVCILNDKEIISLHFPVYTSMPMSFHITTKASIFSNCSTFSPHNNKSLLLLFQIDTSALVVSNGGLCLFGLTIHTI